MQPVSIATQRSGTALGAILLLTSPAGVAETSPAYCPNGGMRLSNGAVSLSAARITGRVDGRSVLEGGVQLTAGSNRLRADRIVYDAGNGRLKASGSVGYTNCDPRDPSWFISAREVSYNENKKSGLIKEGWLRFGGVPVFYVPRYRFVTGDKRRKSGFLAPSLSGPGDDGYQLALPFYINWAPNRDVTLTPHYYSKRGLQFNLESRYLHPLHRGKLELSWLDDHRYDGERHAYKFDHRMSAGDKFSMTLGLQHVSDDHYLEDLGRDFGVYGESYLRSHLSSDWFWRGWRMNFATEKLARSDYNAPPSPQPYQKRPQFSIGKRFNTGALGFGLFSGTTRFINKHDDGGDGRGVDRATRFYNVLDAEWSYRRPGFHFTPAAALSHTHYNLRGEGSRRRTLPSYSLRSGLVFGKDLAAGRYRHTLEPELFYLNVPRRRQDEWPLFDTSESEFRFAQMFAVNRFNGIDRIGDADRLTTALSSRIVHNRTGIEALRVGVGRMHYFRDRKVGIANRPQRSNKSDIAGEVAVNLNNKIRFLSSLIWNTGSNETVKNTAALSLNGSDGRTINLFYRQRRDAFEPAGNHEQAGINFRLPFGAFSVFSAVSYDLDSDKALNALAGFEYRACCWGLSFGIQRRLRNVANNTGRIAEGGLDYDNFIGLQLNLQGIGRVGDNIDRLARGSVFTD